MSKKYTPSPWERQVTPVTSEVGVYYHVTKAGSIQGIIKEGLRKPTYMTSSPEEALAMLRSLDDMEQAGYAGIVKIRLTPEQIKLLKVDKSQPLSFYLEEAILPKQMEEIGALELEEATPKHLLPQRLKNPGR